MPVGTPHPHPTWGRRGRPAVSVPRPAPAFSPMKESVGRNKMVPGGCLFSQGSPRGLGVHAGQDSWPGRERGHRAGPLWGNPRAGSMLFTFLGPGAPMACSPEFLGLGPG